VDFIGDDVVVAHNAGFDLRVIRYACALDSIEWPEMRFLCTLVMARRAMALPTYRLPFLAETLASHSIITMTRSLMRQWSWTLPRGWLRSRKRPIWSSWRVLYASP